MKCFVAVTETPFTAVTGPEGTFEIKGLPAGTYKISWWHEELGKEKTEELTVEAGKATATEIKVGGKKKHGGPRGRLARPPPPPRPRVPGGPAAWGPCPGRRPPSDFDHRGRRSPNAPASPS
jgi:hypothetical protein